MNQGVIKDYIKHLSALEFSQVAMLVLRHLVVDKALNVDGVGDCGKDVIFLTSDKNDCIAAQITVQERSWEQKIKDDLRKANKRKHIDRFYVFVRQEVTEKGKHRLASFLFQEEKTFVEIYGAREVSACIMEDNLVSDFENIIHPQEADNSAVINDELCRVLYSYYTLSNDQKKLQGEIVDAVILYLIADGITCDKASIISKVIDILQMDEDLATEMIERRLDGLMTTGRLQKKEQHIFTLSVDSMNEMLLSKKNYENAINRFASMCDDVILKNGGNGSRTLAEKIAMSVTKCHVLRQIESAKNSLIEIRLMGLTSSLRNWYEELSQLLHQSGIVDYEKVDSTIREIVSCAPHVDIVKRLLSAVVYIGIRQSPHSYSAIILQSDSWKKVSVYLDATVAIPYIATYLHGCSTARFSKASKTVVDRLKSIGAQLFLPSAYLNECAAHLIAATKYCFDFSDFDDDFAYSHNGFVEHYFSLKQMGTVRVPPSFKEYLEGFSEHLFYCSQDYTKVQVARVEADIMDVFIDCGVKEKRFNQLDFSREQDSVSTEYAYEVKNQLGRRSELQERHDVMVLSALQGIGNANRANQILLTWDRTLIKVAQKLRHRYWAVNPAEAADLIQGRTDFSDSAYFAVGTVLGKVAGEKHDLAGRMIDRIVSLCSERLTNAEYRQNITKIKDEVYDRCKEIGYEKCCHELEERIHKFDPSLEKDGSDEQAELINNTQGLEIEPLEVSISTSTTAR